MNKIIRVIDLETTGFTPDEHGVCELGYCDVVLDGNTWRVSGGTGWLVNPGRPIPAETSAIHHIVDEDVIDAPSFRDAWTQIVDGDDVVAYAAHNAKFERAFIPEEMTSKTPWVCTYKAALRLWPASPVHSNQGLRYWRRPDGLDRTVAREAHRAYPDAYVTAFLLRDMLNDGASLDDLIRWADQPALQVRCHIGKWRGALWTEVDYGFLEWISQRDFEEDVLFTVRHEMDRRDEEWRKANEQRNEG